MNSFASFLYSRSAFKNCIQVSEAASHAWWIKNTKVMEVMTLKQFMYVISSFLANRFNARQFSLTSFAFLIKRNNILCRVSSVQLLLTDCLTTRALFVWVNHWITMRKYRLVAKKGEGTFSEVLKAQNVRWQVSCY